MDIKDKIKNTDVIILCGGLGSRLKPTFPNQQKVLIKIKNRVFLDLIIEDLVSFDFKRIIFCVGHLKEQVKKHVSQYNNFEIIFSEENIPLGTGGAIKKAQSLIKSNPFLVLNGDSICRINYHDFLDSHQARKTILTMALSKPNDRTDAGNVVISSSQNIVKFTEKSNKQKKGLINAGIYIMDKEIFKFMPKKERFSLEYDLFPNLIPHNPFGFLSQNEVIDIGTVDRYLSALKLL